MRYLHGTETHRYRVGWGTGRLLRWMPNRREAFRELLVREGIEFAEKRGPFRSTFTVIAPRMWHDTFKQLRMRRVK